MHAFDAKNPVQSKKKKNLTQSITSQLYIYNNNFQEFF